MPETRVAFLGFVVAASIGACRTSDARLIREPFIPRPETAYVVAGMKDGRGNPPGGSMEEHRWTVNLCKVGKSIDGIARELDRAKSCYAFREETETHGVISICTHLTAWRVYVTFDKRTRAVTEVKETPQF
jgi:hypothetical protein